MTLVFRITWFWFFSYSAVSAAAQPPATSPVIELKQADSIYHLNGATEKAIFIPLSEEIDITDIIKNGLRDLDTSKASVQPKFSVHSRYVVAVELSNQSNYSDWILHFQPFLIDKLDIVLFDDGQQPRHHFLDFTTSEKPDVYESVVGRGFPITLPKSDRMTLVIALSADSHLGKVSLSLMERRYYSEVANTSNSTFTFALGIIVSSIIGALGCYAIIRDKVFIWFAISSFLFMLTSMSRSHFGTFILEPENHVPQWMWAVIGLLLLSLYKFSISFLRTDDDSPRIAQLHEAVLFIVAANSVVGIFAPLEICFGLFIISGFLVTSISIALGLIKAIRKGTYFILFSLGWLPILISVLESVVNSNITMSNANETLFFKQAYEPFYQAAHFFLHFFATILRVSELGKKKLEAEANSRAKTLFLASVSHDLRQPVHSMRLLSEHLEPEIKTPHGKAILEKLEQVHVTLDDTFNALMDWSQIDAGKISVDKKSFSLASITKELEAEFQAIALQKNIKLSFRTLPISLNTDPLLFCRIIRNLLSNAIKYTSQGRILVATRRKEREWIIEVWDTGCGISDSALPTIFDIYKRAESGTVTATGSGIGLANVKLLSDALGYGLTVKSKINKGTVFRLHIPEADVSQARPSDLPIQASPPLTVFNLIEAPQLRQKVSAYLNKWDYAVCESVDVIEHVGLSLFLTDSYASFVSSHINNKNFMPRNPEKTIVGVFSQQPQKTPQQPSFDLHRLSPSVSPGELRAFLRYAENRKHES